MFSRLADAGILTENVLHKPVERSTLHSLTAPYFVSRFILEIKLEKYDTVQSIYLLTALCAAVVSTSLVMMSVTDIIRSCKTNTPQIRQMSATSLTYFKMCCPIIFVVTPCTLVILSSLFIQLMHTILIKLLNC